jgi:hypothetical protein
VADFSVGQLGLPDWVDGMFFSHEVHIGSIRYTGNITVFVNDFYGNAGIRPDDIIELGRAQGLFPKPVKGYP